MKNAYAISSLARQLSKVGEKVDSLAMGIQDTEQNAQGVSEVYQGLLMDEIEHVQILTLELTRLVAESSTDAVNADDADGSVFAEGDLQDDLGAKGEGAEGEAAK